MPERSPRRSRWLARLLLAAASFLAALGLAAVAAEIWLRAHPGSSAFAALGAVYDFHESDGHGGVRTVPGYRGVKVVEGRTIPIRLNALGMRGPEIGAREPGELRVLVLGDSMAFGHGVLESEAFPAVLETLLERELSRPVTVGNAGVPGNAHHEQLRDLRRHREVFDPDLVLSCVYTGNDFDGDFFGPKRVVEGYYFDTQTARFLESCWRARLALRFKTAYVVEKWLERHLPALAIDRSSFQPTAEERARYAAFSLPRDEGLFMDVVDAPPIVETVLARMEDTLRGLREEARGAPVLSVVLPSFVETWPGVHAAAAKALGMDPSALRRGLGARRFEQRCARLGMPCLDLTASMAAHAAPQELYLPHDLHLSARGHRFVAERLAPWVAAALRHAIAPAQPGGG